MERKIVVRKTKHSDFLFGYPYVAEVIGSVLRIKDPKFTGDSHIIYSTDEFYCHDEKNDNNDSNKCITMSYLTNYNGYMIFRGAYFMCGDYSVDDDSKCYYIYQLGKANKDTYGVFTQYDKNGKYFASDSDAINYLKVIIDRTIEVEGNEDECNELILSDFETFGHIFVYILNAGDMLKVVDADSCVEELEGLDFMLDEVMF
jgi:hypothetical protein